MSDAHRPSKSILTVLVAALPLLAVGCLSRGERRDLAENEDYYRHIGYRATVPADRDAFLAPMRDERQSAAGAEEAAQSDHMVRWMREDVWERTPAQMVDQIFRDEVAASGIVGSVSDRITSDALVIESSLLSFRAGIRPFTSGRSAVAECTIRVVVHGPVEDGERPVILDEVYAGRSVSAPMFKAPTLAESLGDATRKAMLGILSGIDQANVGRRGMPMLDLHGADTSVAGR